jgi:N-acetylglucosamine-6-phosphate deacetylase
MLLKGGRAVMLGGRIEVVDVLITGGRIEAVGAPLEAGEATVYNAGGLVLAPGFIDVHVHGGGGYSLITNDAEEIVHYARWVVKYGVTSFLATICADSPQAGVECVRAAARIAGPIEGGATLLGVNLEGPFVSPDRGGALPTGWIEEPDLQLLGRLLAAGNGTVRAMTVAPELPGAHDVIKAARDSGMFVSVGHTDAKHRQAAAAFGAGASHVTHAFNAMRPLHHREPGPLGAALESPGVTVEVIADGVHLHPATVALLVRAFGPGRVCLVTDAVSPAGLGAGSFRIDRVEARLDGVSVRLPDGTIAGSAATMDLVVRNIVSWNAATLAEASAMASGTPARALGIGEQKGLLAPGYDADIVALDDTLQVVATWVGGREVYARDGKITRGGTPAG